MNGKSVYTIVPPSPRGRAVQDEWGLFDPNQAGLKAAFRAVRALNGLRGLHWLRGLRRLRGLGLRHDRCHGR